MRDDVVRSDATPVVVFRAWDAVPVFHLYAPWMDQRDSVVELDDGTVQHSRRVVTLCGRLRHAWGWLEHPGEPWPDSIPWFSLSWSVIDLRRDHAEKLGRLCERCARAVG